MMVGGFAGRLHVLHLPRRICPPALARDQAVLYRFLLNKWYFDEHLRSHLRAPGAVARPLFCGRAATAASSTASDPTASRRASLDVTRNVVRLQTGYLYHYAFAMLIGVAAFVTWFMFAGGPH